MCVLPQGVCVFVCPNNSLTTNWYWIVSITLLPYNPSRTNEELAEEAEEQEEQEAQGVISCSFIFFYYIISIVIQTLQFFSFVVHCLMELNSRLL